MNGMMLVLETMDERLLLALVGHRRRFADLLMRAITHLADPVTAISLALGLLWTRTPEVHAVGVQVVFALVSSHLAVQLLKRTVARPRPRLPAGLDFLVTPPDRFSFPSGHAAAALSLALPVALALPALPGLLVLLLGIVVGMSRCYLGVHYPGDVLAGWLLASLGVLAGALTIPLL